MRIANRGHTLIEVTIAASLSVVVILMATGVSGSIGETSSYGRRLLDTRSENQRALHFIANDLQNSSSGLDPDSAAPRFTLADDTVVSELVTRTAESASRGAVLEATPVDEESEVSGSRPRMERHHRNSRFSFRRVVGHEVDPEYGDVHAVWSDPIVYRVEGRKLLRIQDGRPRVIGIDVSAFKVYAEEDGLFRVFLRTQKRNPSTGEVLTVSGSIEVNPKN